MRTYVENLIKKAGLSAYSFADSFVDIITMGMDDRGDDVEGAFASFIEDLQYGGCASGLVGDFIYTADCESFYVCHMDDLEEFIAVLESEIGPVSNKRELPRATFVCWLCFEEFCHTLSNLI